jgi:hypothetical protein
MSGVAFSSLAYDWKRPVLFVFKGLLEARTAGVLAEFETSLSTIAPRDLLLLFEFAMCAHDDALIELTTRKLRERAIKVPVEIWLRIAVWPNADGKRMLTVAAKVVSEPSNVHKFVHAMLVAMGDPAAFKRFFFVCPRPDVTLPPPAIEAIMGVAWESSIVQTLSNSWIDDDPHYTGFWTQERLTPVECHEMRKPYIYWTTMLKTLAHYRKALPGSRALDTSCFNYTPAAERPPVEEPFFVQQGALFDALNEFAADRPPPEQPLFVPARQCDDTSHLICTLAAKSRTAAAAASSSAGSSPPKAASTSSH